MNIPEGFELVNDIPEGFELVEEEKPSKLKQAAKDAFGGVEAAATMLGGLPSYIYSGYQGLGHLFTGGDASTVGDAVRGAQESNFGFGAPIPYTESGKQATEMLGAGMEAVKDTAGGLGEKYGGNLGRMNAEIAAETILNFLPIPGGKGVKKLAGAIEKRLPTKEVVPEVKIPEKTAIPEGYELVEGDTPMQKQLALREAMDAREQTFADKNNVQGELDLRSKEMLLDENGMPVDMARSLDVQNEYAPAQRRLFDEDQTALFEEQRARELEATQAREAGVEVPDSRLVPEKAAQEAQMWEQHKAEQTRLMEEELQANKDDALSALEEKLRVPRKQRGAIEIGSDMDAVKTRFQKFSVEAEPVQFGSNNSVMVRLKTPDGKLAGFVDFAVREDGTLVAENAQVAEGLRGKGAAQRMYLAAREAGYDIAPGRVQTDLGNKMVASLQKRGLINKEAEGPRFSAGDLNLQPLEGEQLPGYPRAMNSPGGRDSGIQKPTYKLDAEGKYQSTLKDGTEVEFRRTGDGINEEAKLEAYIGDRKIGDLFYTKTGETLPDVYVHDNFQRMGVATQMYNLAYNDGAVLDLPTGNTRTPNGLAFRNKWVPPSQMGAANFGSIVESINKVFGTTRTTPKSLQEIIANNRIPKDALPKDTINEALKEGKDTDAWNTTKKTASGSTLEAMTRRSALVRDVSRTVQNAIKRADLYTRETVIPVENAFRKLSSKAVEDLAKVFKWEAENHKLMTAEQLEASGMTEKQMAAYADMRKLNQDTLTIQNEARERLGLKPIDNKEYHVASRWRGDYRQPVYKKVVKEDGTTSEVLAWYLAADSKIGLNKQAKALLKEHPDLIIDPKKGHVSKSGGAKNDVQMMYSTMLDVLGRDNPAVQAMKEAYEAAVATETSSALGQTKHAERKADIRGFVGDRPGFSAKTEAFEMFQEQIQHAKNAYKWSALQEAGGKLKEVFSNEELAAQQPKNMEYAKDYYQNALGHGTAKWVAATENAFRELGVSPAVVDKIIGSGKSVFITQKLAASTGYTMAGLIQLLNSVPHLVDTFVKQGGNPLTALPLGMLTGITMASGHYLNKLGGSFDKVLKGMDSVQSIRFLDEAFKYAEDNGVTSRSIYDENPINQRGIVSGAMNVASKTMTVPETGVRSAAYMTFVHMLKDSKKFKTNEQIFQRAEELTNASMVDYRASERPMMFANMGVVGNALNTLQTFPINLYNQYRYFTKEAARGNVAPLIAMLSLQYAMAGAMGIPGFNDMDKLFGWAKEKLPDSAWAKVKDFDPKIWMIENLGESSVYGALSTESGVSMTNRLSAPGLGDMAASPLAPGADLLKQAGHVASAVGDPSDPTKRAQAVHAVSPTGLQGVVETKLFPEQFSVDRPDGSKLWKKASDLSSRQGQYVRTPKEEQLRTMGLRSQREVLSNELGYKTGAMERQVVERSKGLVDKYYNAVRNGNMKRADEINTLYTKLNGSEITRQHIETQIMDEFTSTLEKSEIAAKKIEALKGMARVRTIMEKHDANTRATQ